MKRFFSLFGLSSLFVLAGASVLCAAEGTASPEAIQFFCWVAVATGIGMGIAAIGTGIGQGHGVQGACDGIARNPEASGKKPLRRKTISKVWHFRPSAPAFTGIR